MALDGAHIRTLQQELDRLQNALVHLVQVKSPPPAAGRSLPLPHTSRAPPQNLLRPPQLYKLLKLIPPPTLGPPAVASRM